MKNGMLVAIVALLAAAVAAQADTVVYSWTTVASDSNSHNSQLPKLDPNIGTLNSVTVALGGTGSFSLTFQNRGASPASVDEIHGALISNVWAGWDGPKETLLRSYPTNIKSGPHALEAFDGIEFAGRDCLLWKGTIHLVSSETFYLVSDANVLSLFTGTGNINMNTDYVKTISWVGTGSGLEATPASFDCSILTTVTYDYTPVPEPATMSLLGLGAIATMRRRKHCS